MRYTRRKHLTNSLIVLYWILTITMLSFISISSIKGFLNLSGFEVDMANEMALYWLSPHQYLESFLFGLFFGLLFIQVNALSKRLKIEKFGFGKSILINSGIYVLGFAIIIALVYLIIGSLGYYNEMDISSIGLDNDVIGLLLVVIGIIVFQILFLNFVIQSVEIMGDYNLLRFLTGKYRTPIVEDRAFMFLDLRSSTEPA